MKNYMELLVDQIYDEVKYIYGDCNIPDCVYNIKAMALNNLPPAYFKSNISDGEKKAFLLDRQRRIAVLAKVAEAAELICSGCSEKHSK